MKDTDLNAIELRIVAAHMQHQEGEVPALRLGARIEAPDGVIAGTCRFIASADAWRNLPNSKGVFK